VAIAIPVAAIVPVMVISSMFLVLFMMFVISVMVAVMHSTVIAIMVAVLGARKPAKQHRRRKNQSNTKFVHTLSAPKIVTNR